ncbi:MAG TPA: hypothetical protein VKI44_32205 [Acetobacteraceae bacterium]|nr:hypothetical protein [Acetobacteraceae bacterium]
MTETTLPPTQHANDDVPADDDIDPIQETLDALEAQKAALETRHPGLVARIGLLQQAGADPDQRGRLPFRHNVAYLAQDVEKTTGITLTTSPLAREETIKLAGSAPGLKNERMLALLNATSAIRDQELTDQIRATGGAIGRQRDQYSPDVRSRIESLENLVHRAQRPDASTSPSAGNAGGRESDMPRPPFNEPAADITARRSEADATYNAVHQAPSNRAGAGQSPQQQTQVVFKPSVLDSVFRAYARPTAATALRGSRCQHRSNRA